MLQVALAAAAMAVVATVASVWLVHKHLKWYSCKAHQRNIVRLLFMVPIYALVTLAAYLFSAHTTSLLIIRDAYESVVVAAFFALLLEYLPGPTPANPTPLGKPQRAAIIHRTFYQRQITWIFPFRSLRPPDGLAYLHSMKCGILQYCIVRPGSSLAAIILQQYDLYREPSWSWRWGHVWLVTIVSISVTVAMYCLVQLYSSISHQLAPHRPLLKLFAVKAVVFLTFWQSALLSGLASLHVIKDSNHMSAHDISALLQTFEMMCFALLHIKAFSYVPYKQMAAGPASPTQQATHLLWAFSFSDTWRDLYAGLLYFFRRGSARGADKVAKRQAGYHQVFGRERIERRGPILQGLRYSPLPTPEDADVEVDAELDAVVVGRAAGDAPRTPVSPPPRGAMVTRAPGSFLWPPERVSTLPHHTASRNGYAPVPRSVHPIRNGALPRNGSALLRNGSGLPRNGSAQPPHLPRSILRAQSPQSQSQSQALLHPPAQLATPLATSAHISPASAYVLAQTSPLFQQSFNVQSAGQPGLCPPPGDVSEGHSRDDSLLKRVFSGATRTTESRDAGLEHEQEQEQESCRTVGDGQGSVTECSVTEGSDQTHQDSVRTDDAHPEESEAALVQPARAISLRTGAPRLVRIRGPGPGNPPDSPTRSPTPGRSVWQPRTIVLPTPLRPARYEGRMRASPSRGTPTLVMREATRLAHVPSVHLHISDSRALHWSPIQPQTTGSSESGALAGRSGAGAMMSNETGSISSLSTLSNLEEGNPAPGTSKRRSDESGLQF